jgi:hypothetical protein
MAWEVHRLVNEEGLTILGPYKTKHWARWESEKDGERLRILGYDLVWYEFVEVLDGARKQH